MEDLARSLVRERPMADNWKGDRGSPDGTTTTTVLEPLFLL
jgi:hypothetical protein